MSVVGYRCDIADHVLIGTLDLWRVRSKMPFRMHEKRQFTWEKDGSRYVFSLDISRHRAVMEHYQYTGDSVECSRSRVRDMYLENGLLTVDTRSGIHRVGA